MTATSTEETVRIHDGKRGLNLPPLILHPFAQPQTPAKLVDSSRASLIIQGLLPAGTATKDELECSLLDGRYAELRMLYYVGKDILRWIEQCLEHVERSAGFPRSRVVAQSFASLLIQHTPADVAEKLKRWGVSDYKSIFSRSLGLNAMFTELPPRTMLADEFIRTYFRYADQLFYAYQNQFLHTELSPEQFSFDLYSSAEYSRMLERQWE